MGMGRFWITCCGKSRRKMTKAAGKCADWKKAIVTLKDGDTIALH